jgi:diamine N-acetyltransferase
VTYTIREAHEDDARFIRELFLLPHARAFLNTPTREMIVATMDDPAVENYIIEDDGEPAGNLVLRNHGFLVDVSVIVVAHQRRGAGAYALQWALEHAFAELGAHRVFLETREDNEVIRRLVERLGFVQEGTYRHGFQDERSGTYHNLCAYGMLEHEYQALALK